MPCSPASTKRNLPSAQLMRLLCRRANSDALQVDHIFPVVGAYTEQLQQYETAVLAGGLPSAASTRELHAMQRDLRRIDRTIAPLQVRTVCRAEMVPYRKPFVGHVAMWQAGVLLA